jgi:hypothetical protein
MSEEFQTEVSNEEVCQQFDEESVEHDADGTGITVIGERLGTALLQIERFVEEAVLSDSPAFSMDAKGRWKQLRLGRHRHLMNAYFRHYSHLNGYGPYVDLFFETATSFGNFPSPFEFNWFVEALRAKYRSEAFQCALTTQSIDEKKRARSLTDYVDALFESCGTLLIVRIDLLYRYDAAPVTLERALSDFDRMMANSRHNKIFEGKIGFIRRLEFGELRGHYHFHVLFFFDGSVRRSGYHVCELLGAYWKKITQGQGHFENCNSNEAMYERKGMLAIGKVNHRDVTKRSNITRVINYFVKREQLLRRKAVGVTKAITRGEMPKPKARKLGRPRQSPVSTGEGALREPHACKGSPCDALLRG